MPENVTDANDPSWMNNRTLVLAWLLEFFPVGLYAVWKGNLFDRQKKWIITGIVIGLIVVLGGGALLNFMAGVVFGPLAVFLCWRDPRVSRSTTLKFAGGAVVLFVLFLASPAPVGPRPDALLRSGDCTYFRDSDNNVIGRSCD